MAAHDTFFDRFEAEIGNGTDDSISLPGDYFDIPLQQPDHGTSNISRLSLWDIPHVGPYSGQSLSTPGGGSLSVPRIPTDDNTLDWNMITLSDKGVVGTTSSNTAKRKKQKMAISTKTMLPEGRHLDVNLLSQKEFEAMGFHIPFDQELPIVPVNTEMVSATNTQLTANVDGGLSLMKEMVKYVRVQADGARERANADRQEAQRQSDRAFHLQEKSIDILERHTTMQEKAMELIAMMIRDNREPNCNRVQRPTITYDTVPVSPADKLLPAAAPPSDTAVTNIAKPLSPPMPSTPEEPVNKSISIIRVEPTVANLSTFMQSTFALHLGLYCVVPYIVPGTAPVYVIVGQLMTAIAQAAGISFGDSKSIIRSLKSTLPGVDNPVAIRHVCSIAGFRAASLSTVTSKRCLVWTKESLLTFLVAADRKSSPLYSTTLEDIQRNIATIILSTKMYRRTISDIGPIGYMPSTTNKVLLAWNMSMRDWAQPSDEHDVKEGEEIVSKIRFIRVGQEPHFFEYDMETEVPVTNIRPRQKTRPK